MRTGRPPGTGKWQRVLFNRLQESAKLGVPVIPLIQPGTSRKRANQLMVAAKLLAKHGLVIKFRMWHPRPDVANKRLRTYLALPGAEFDGEPVEKIISDLKVDGVYIGGLKMYPGSIHGLRAGADTKMSEAEVRAVLGDNWSVRPGLSGNIRKAVVRRDGYRCTICGRDVLDAKLEVHHVVPVSDGGTDDMDNLTTVCARCHPHSQDEIQAVATTCKKSRSPGKGLRSVKSSSTMKMQKGRG